MPRYKVQVHLEVELDCAQPGDMGESYDAHKVKELTSKVFDFSNSVTCPTLDKIIDN